MRDGGEREREREEGRVGEGDRNKEGGEREGDTEREKAEQKRIW